MSALTNVKRFDETEKKMVPVENAELIDDKTKLEWDPIPFKAFGRITRTTNAELSRTIKLAFLATMHDMAGVLITLEPGTGRWIAELWFEYNNEPLPANKIHNVRQIAKDKSTNPYARRNGIYRAISGETHVLTDETKILLAPFMYGGKDQNKPDSKNWTQNVEEVHSAPPMGYYRSGDRIQLRVKNVDPYKLLQMLYGRRMVVETVTSRTPDGRTGDMNTKADAMYEMRYAGTNNQTGEIIINIEQFDNDGVKELFAKEHPIAMSGMRYFS